MKSFMTLVIGSLMSASVFANTLVSIDTKITGDTAVVKVVNLSGSSLVCDYKIRWNTSILDHHLSWGTVEIKADESATILVESTRGLAIKKATPTLSCDTL